MSRINIESIRPGDKILVVRGAAYPFKDNSIHTVAVVRLDYDYIILRDSSDHLIVSSRTPSLEIELLKPSTLLFTHHLGESVGSSTITSLKEGLEGKPFYALDYSLCDWVTERTISEKQKRSLLQESRAAIKPAEEIQYYDEYRYDGRGTFVGKSISEYPHTPESAFSTSSFSVVPRRRRVRNMPEFKQVKTTL